MQRIEYEAPNGRVTVFDAKGPPFILVKVDGVTGLPTQQMTVSPAALDGELYYGSRIEPREVTVNLHVAGSDLQDLYLNRAELIRNVSSSQNAHGRLGILRYLNDAGSFWLPAEVYQNPNTQAEVVGRRYQEMQVVFRCPDPVWRVSEATIDRMAYLSGGFLFPLKIPAVTQAIPGIKFGNKGYIIVILNEGDQASPLEITITGPAVNPTITNKSTGETLRVKRDLQEFDSLYINTERGNKRVQVTTALGQSQDAMGYIDAGSVFFQLVPGENEIEYFSGNDSTSASVVIKTFDRLGGV